MEPQITFAPTKRQMALLTKLSETLGIPLDELMRRVVDEWMDEVRTKPYTPPPFPIVPTRPDLPDAPSVPSWPIPYTVTVYSVGEPCGTTGTSYTITFGKDKEGGE